MNIWQLAGRSSKASSLQRGAAHRISLALYGKSKKVYAYRKKKKQILLK